MVERAEVDALPPTRPDPLAAWALGTFHACLLMVVLVLLGMQGDRLGSLLSESGTVPGILLFVSLWGLSVWTTRRALVGVMEGTQLVARAGAAVGRAVVWGGVTGAFFLLALVAVFLLPNVRLEDGLAPLVAVPFLLVAMGVAFVVGSLVGAVFGTLDVLLVRARDAFLQRRG